jgi:HEAT repeat protein
VESAERAWTLGQPEAILARYRDRIGQITSAEVDVPLRTTVRMLHEGAPIPEPVLLARLASEDREARWLAAEAYLLHGRSLSRHGFEALLEQDEEYVRVAATDVLLRFADDILPYTVEALQHLDDYSQTGARAAYLLTQSASLRTTVFEALVSDPRVSVDARVTVACLTGALLGDWGKAMDLVEPVREAAGLAPVERARLRKKLRALEMLTTLGGWNKPEEAEKSRRLAKLGRDVTDLMLVAAISPHRRFRRSVVAVLAELADPRATELLIHVLEDDYSQVRKRAIAGLIRIGEEAVDPLIEAASSDRLRTRRYAAHCLGRIGAPRAKPTIIEALGDSEEVVRRQAVRALKELATTEDLPTLKRFLREALPENAVEATEVLEALGGAGTEAMQRMALEEHVAGAAYFIARQGDDRGREILAAQLDQEGEAHDAAVEFLRELRDERAVPYLIEQLAASTDWHGTFLAQELGAIGNQEAVAALIASLERDEHLIRRGAVRGLDDAQDPAAIDPLVRCLDDSDGKVRRLASEALAHLGPPARAAVREALETVDERNGRLRSILRSTLGSLEGQT